MRDFAILATLALFPAVAAAQSIPEQGGSEVVVERRTGSAEERGELIAVTSDSLWVLADRTLVAVPTEAVLRVRVRRGVLGSKMNWTWSLVAGGVSGLALTGACSSVQDADCGGVFVAMLLSWVLYGGISASSMSHANYETIGHWRQLIPYARFPAGIPEGVGATEIAGSYPPD